MIILRILLAMAVTFIMSNLLDGIQLESWEVALVFSIFLTLLNVTVGRLVKFLGCFIQLITLGLFGLLVNVAIIQFVANNVDGITISNWPSALALSLAISFVSMVTLDDLNQDKKGRK